MMAGTKIAIKVFMIVNLCSFQNGIKNNIQVDQSEQVDLPYINQGSWSIANPPTQFPIESWVVSTKAIIAQDFMEERIW